VTADAGETSAWEPPASGLVRVETEPAYSVAIGPGILAHLPHLAQGLGFRQLALLTDETVEGLLGKRLDGLDWHSPVPRFSVAAGEASKSFAVLEGVLDFLVRADLDRSSALVTFGGGVVGDLGGLAAGLFMRGIAVIQCPTTLLAMVDSSVGGKTAVNLASGKNLAGCFHQPAAVLADTSLLASLPVAELASGLGEVIKTALIGDPELLEFLGRESRAIRSAETGAMDDIVARCVRVKAAVVAEDEREGGRRKVLNLGHTFGHAIELVAGFGVIPHGVAIATGLSLAARASEAAGLLLDADLPELLEARLAAMRLPATLAELRGQSDLALPADALLEGLRHDKKSRGGEPAFVLPRAVGDVLVDCELDRELVRQLLA
jgi:3-dehydroquinate synthase